jgi:pimeloyl-ACP methyl ester carboxylesterase
MSEMKKNRFWWRVALALAAFFIVLVLGFVIWGDTPAKPMPEALAALQSDGKVTVQSDRWLTFQPLVATPVTGFIFYPGGRVDYRAYAPAAHAIAAAGYLVVIVPMPLNLAVFDPNAAAAVIAAYPEIKHWVVGGHSLGGSMAANFAHSHSGKVAGLVLWASYPAGSDDLSASGLKILSVSGTLDGLSTPAKIEASKLLLSANSLFVPILGGDHAGFGWYGPQAGDHPASISRQDQQFQIVQATVAFLGSLK